jgi:hypothetical protein
MGSFSKMVVTFGFKIDNVHPMSLSSVVVQAAVNIKCEPALSCDVRLRGRIRNPWILQG